ncbi:MAG TPA: cysteine desulfurase family protein [Anaeromyxobacteraceae bacterium]|nr:cysteine desulfurase family protein [Anaeromyxobacteraceae bacterium]
MHAMHYLDHNAITPMRPEAKAAVTAALDVFGNPASVHAAGRAARDLLDHARAQVATALGARLPEIVFTSGATEAAALAIRGVLGAAPAGREDLVVTSVEHPCVLGLAESLRAGGRNVTVLPVDGRGVPDLAAAAEAVTPRTALVCAMVANNETGVLLPVRELAALARDRGALFFTDAVQAVGKVELDVRTLGADLLALTGQKFGGPRGAGALWVKSGLRLAPLLGGTQERGRRAGTENLPGIAGLGAAIEAATARREVERRRVGALRDRLEAGLLAAVPGTRVNGSGAPRLPGTLSVTLPATDAEALLIALDLEGICASAGSACHSGSTNPSSVLRAMGLSVAEARSTLRLSLGWSSDDGDVDAALEAIPRLAARVQAEIPAA